MNSTTWIRSLALVAALVVTFVPEVGKAQWRAVPSQATTESGSDALVRNDDGAELRIWLDEDAYLRASFRLPSGLVTLDPKGCPTFQIDEGKPENLATELHECAVSGDQVRVVLARADDGEVDSPTLLDLMNGGKLRVRFRLMHAGYGSASFSLRGSKQALNTALGETMKVIGQ